MNRSEKLSALYSKSYEMIKDLLLYQPDDFRIEQIEYDDSNRVDSAVVSYLVKRNLTSVEEKFVSAFIQANQIERIYKEIRFNNEEEIKGVYMHSN